MHAIKAFLDTLTPARQQNKPTELPWPSSVREVMAGWNKLYFHEGAFKPDPNKSEQWNRGAYLVEGLGHCGACHTDTNVLGAAKTGEKLQGGDFGEHWYAPGLTCPRVDQPVAQGVDEPARPGGLRQVSSEQFVVADPHGRELLDQGRPPGAGVTNEGMVMALGLERAQIQTAVLAQIAAGESGGHGGGKVLPGKPVDVVCAVGGDRGPGRRRRGRHHVQRSHRRDPKSGEGSLSQCVHCIGEGQVVSSGDELDDVASGSAAEALEPFGHSPDGRGRGGVVGEAEGRAAFKGAKAGKVAG